MRHFNVTEDRRCVDLHRFIAVALWCAEDLFSETANEIMDDLRSGLVEQIILMTDGYNVCLEALKSKFGDDVDHAMLVKL